MVSPLTTVWDRADADSVQASSIGIAAHRKRAFFIITSFIKQNAEAPQGPRSYGTTETVPSVFQLSSAFQQPVWNSWQSICQSMPQSNLNIRLTSQI
jgi:hypothetical protein